VARAAQGRVSAGDNPAHPVVQQRKIDSVKSNMRILHIGNGRAFKIKAIVDSQVRRGHDVHVLPIPPVDGAWEGVTWHCLPPATLPGQAKVLQRLWQVRSLARRLCPDIVHAHNAWGPGWYAAATGIRPLVIHAYGSDFLPEQYAGRPAFQRRLTSWACRSASRIIVTGRHMLDAAGKLQISSDRLMLLPRGVDVRRYRPGLDTNSLRHDLGLGAKSPVILSPRYQVDESLYNLDVVIDAFATVRQRYPDAVCVQMYEPSRIDGRTRLARRAAERGLGESYRLVPAVDNATMPLFYNLADVVVSIPSSDGFPVSVLEASACAAPLVVSRLAYCAEWFGADDTGVVVPVGDAGATADAVLALWADEPRRRRLGAAARIQVQERADYDRCMDQLDLTCRQLVQARQGGVNPARPKLASRRT
jgi:glycosyltransferase involved in cell wall biosynthesis